ncbi:MAG: hypothetical protein WCI27_06070, partial [Candidatus Omnitrophota bacterium]
GLVNVSRNWKYSSSSHYFGSRKDEMIDDYAESIPTMPADLEMGDVASFENGLGIGSGYFKLRLNEKLKAECRDCDRE